jgi:hypothetical protein
MTEMLPVYVLSSLSTPGLVESSNSSSPNVSGAYSSSGVGLLLSIVRLVAYSA